MYKCTNYSGKAIIHGHWTVILNKIGQKYADDSCCVIKKGWEFMVQPVLSSFATRMWWDRFWQYH